MRERVFTYIVPMPSTVNALTVAGDIDEYTVYLNDCLTYEAQQQAYMHEIRHIKNRDFDHFHNVNTLEKLR